MVRVEVGAVVTNEVMHAGNQEENEQDEDNGTKETPQIPVSDLEGNISRFGILRDNFPTQAKMYVSDVKQSALDCC